MARVEVDSALDSQDRGDPTSRAKEDDRSCVTLALPELIHNLLVAVLNVPPNNFHHHVAGHRSLILQRNQFAQHVCCNSKHFHSREFVRVFVHKLAEVLVCDFVFRLR